MLYQGGGEHGAADAQGAANAQDQVVGLRAVWRKEGRLHFPDRAVACLDDVPVAGGKCFPFCGSQGSRHDLHRRDSS